MAFRRSAVVLALAAVALCPSVLPAAAAGRVGDRLTVTVTDGRDGDGTSVLQCHPAGGSHPEARRACARLDALTRQGGDPFAPPPADEICSMRYGGPARAHVTGRWQGRPVDASYGRADGCQSARWDHLVPVLPDQR
ncbi:SSI family serine proteinase inhibitor [Kitasatospora sp. NPDC088391]|uniref:SSI family serine proteinase inhibitor n=1 Tax=Kitasatospora sp. NPDC088391 TaxID=3364074 RepID=UPI0037FF4FCD